MKHLILTLLFSLVTASLYPQSYSRADLQADLSNLAFYLPAKVGISFISDRGDTVNINADQSFPLMSVMKFHQALATCATLHNNTLDSTLLILETELNPKTYSPMLKEHPHGGSFSIRQLLEYSLIQSDNNASNILYNRILNPHQVNRFIHGLIDEPDTAKAFHILYSEESMGMDVNKVRENFTTPLAATLLMKTFFERHNDTPAYQYLWNTMSHCQTGQNRIPLYIKRPDVTIVHKTGTGGQLPDGTVLAVNDAACIILPDARFCFLSVFIADANCEMSLCEEFIANVAQIIYQFMTE